MQNHLIRIKTIQKMTGLSRSYIYSLTKQGLFPSSVSLTAQGTAKGWVESEVQDWINQRIEEREVNPNAN